MMAKQIIAKLVIKEFRGLRSQGTLYHSSSSQVIVTGNGSAFQIRLA